MRYIALFRRALQWEGEPEGVAPVAFAQAHLATVQAYDVARDGETKPQPGVLRRLAAYVGREDALGKLGGDERPGVFYLD